LEKFEWKNTLKIVRKDKKWKIPGQGYKNRMVDERERKTKDNTDEIWYFRSYSS